MSALTRRDALLAGAAAPLALALAEPASAAPPSALQKQQARAALVAVLQLEQTAVVAYEAIANSGALPARSTGLLRDFQAQEVRHATQLAMALAATGPKPPLPPRRAEVPGLGAVRDLRSATVFAIALEQRTIAAYEHALQIITDTNLLRTAAGAMGCDGQQLAVLRELAGVEPVPGAFAAGAPR